MSKEQDGDETVVFLIGDENARRKAEELINELTVDRERPNLTVVDTFSNPQTQTQIAEPECIDWQKLSEECVSIIKSCVLESNS